MLDFLFKFLSHLLKEFLNFALKFIIIIFKNQMSSKLYVRLKSLHTTSIILVFRIQQKNVQIQIKIVNETKVFFSFWFVVFDLLFPFVSFEFRFLRPQKFLKYQISTNLYVPKKKLIPQRVK